MARENAYTRFLRDEDTSARRAELEAFVGPGASPYLHMYERLRASPGRAPFGAIVSGVAMAFWLGPCWFFYRKMWGYAWMIIAGIAVLALLPVPAGAGIGVAVALAMFGRYIYFQHAVGAITRLRCGAPVADLDELRRRGGVSRRAGWISSGIYLAMTAIALLSAIAFLSGGGDPALLR